MVYRELFEGTDTLYTKSYFFEEYEKQYGRTYLEDFPALTAFAAARLDVLEKLLPRRKEGARLSVLDVGCAYGAFLAEAARRGWDARGIDIAQSAVDYVQGELGIPAIAGDFLEPRVQAELAAPVDCLSLWFVVEHFDRLGEVLSAAARIVRPGGLLALSTPSGAGISARRDPAAFYGNSPNDHVTVWEPRRTAGILKRYGFRVERIRGTGHHPERFPGALGGSALRSVSGLASRTAGLGRYLRVLCAAHAGRREPGGLMYTILVLGAGLMQIPALRIAKERGWRVIAADGNAQAVGASLADRFEHIDLKDKEALEAAARRLRDSCGLDGVMTAGTDFSASVAWVAERLGLPGVSHETAMNASDKARMRAVFTAAGVPSPRFLVLDRADSDGAPIGELGFPLVVKPVDNMGARGCRLVRNPQELSRALPDALAHSRTGRAIVEEYLEGPEFSLDALVHEGRIIHCGTADRIVTFAPYFVEMGHTMPTAFADRDAAEVVRVFEAGIRALGIRNGAAKGDIKLTARGVFVGEIAARLSGGYMSGWTYPYASGVDPASGALDIAVGQAPRDTEPLRNWVSAERAFISIPGVVASVAGNREALCEPYVKDVFFRIQAGDKVVFPTNNVEKCGNVISQAPDREAAAVAAERAARRILIRLAPRVPTTESFLAGEGRIRNPDGTFWPPDAFSVPETVRKAAEALDGRTAPPPAGKPGRIAYARLPGIERETVRDWQGRTISESLEIVEHWTGIRPDDGRADIVLGAAFWKALFQGGYQGAAYVVDSLRSETPGGKGVQDNRSRLTLPPGLGAACRPGGDSARLPPGAPPPNPRLSPPPPPPWAPA